jgi:hypothetical protein
MYRNLFFTVDVRRLIDCILRIFDSPTVFRPVDAQGVDAVRVVAVCGKSSNGARLRIVDADVHPR